MPPFQPQLKKKQGQLYIFCRVRRNWYVCTPEEFVRQQTAHWLTDCLGYPLALLNIESGDHRGRTDIRIYNRDLKVQVLIECKASFVALDDAVWLQALRYNEQFQAQWLCLANGMEMQVRRRTGQGYEWAEGLPDYSTA